MADLNEAKRYRTLAELTEAVRGLRNEILLSDQVTDEVGFRSGLLLAALGSLETAYGLMKALKHTPQSTTPKDGE